MLSVPAPIEAKRIASKFPQELGFVNIRALEESDAKGCLEVLQDIGFAHFHHRKDGQTTIYSLAVLPEYQKKGWGRLLFYRVLCSSIEAGCDAYGGSRSDLRIFLKCPVDLKANSFYEALGFKLVGTDPGKKRPLNCWEYKIKLPLLFYCGGGGKSRYDAIASNIGWQLGINSGGKIKSHLHMKMVDNDYRNYNHTKHLEMVRQNKPLICTARDIEFPEQLPEILEQAAELSKYAGRVLLIPKCDVSLPEKYWLGYSVPSGHGATSLNPEWFGDRPVHLLGGSPIKQAVLYPQMNVVSLDANYSMNVAKHCKSVYSDGFQNIWSRESGCYQALEQSLVEQYTYWADPPLQKYVQLSLLS
ncbi:MAG: GNAT family N-acetyltransferase [Symploca sp. SIO2G7]|nr:GNAT family N-acetyltransferase [Symploca sp. SIO2G7]